MYYKTIFVSFGFNSIAQFLLCSHELKLSSKTIEIAQKHNFEVRGYSFDAKPEELRLARIVRVNI